MTNDLTNEMKKPGHGGRMSRRRKKEAVLRLLRGDDLEMLSRELGVTAATLSGWQEAFLSGGEASLAIRQIDGEMLESEHLKAKLGEVMIERELLREKIAAMSAAVSPSSGRPHGLAVVCWVWNISRATLYRRRAPMEVKPAFRRRSPTGPMPDAELVGRIRAIISASPFHGEGHRKVWARLRVAGVPSPDAAPDARKRPACPLADRRA